MTAPANNATPHSLTQTFTSNPSTDPDGDGVEYRFFYCTDGTCAARNYMTGWTTTSPWTKTFTFNSSLYNTPLKWGVESRDTPWNTVTTSSLRNLTIVNSAPTITSIAPPNNTIIAGNPPTFTANVTDADADPINYRFVVTPTSGVGIVAASPWTNLAAPGAVPGWNLPAELVTDVNYQWRIETKDSTGATANSTNRTISAQGRLGAGSVSPTQQVGPVSVNLASGNVFYATELGRTIQAVGGPISAGLNYNSHDQTNVGLTGTYYVDADADNQPDPDEIVLSRTDRLPIFDWGTKAPAESVPADGFKVRWTGYIRIPNIAGDWTFAGGHDDRIKITINGQTAYDHTSTVALDDPAGFTGTATPTRPTPPISRSTAPGRSSRRTLRSLVE